MEFTRSASVLFSGGQDSTTCLAWALERFDKVTTIGFNYDQRHAVEMDCRKKVREALADLNPIWKSRLEDDWVNDVNIFREIGGTSLTSSIEIEMDKNGLPNTFVPGRNLLFLLIAAAYSYRKDITNIVLGVCETDFSGYPDCRDDAIKAMQIALNLGMEKRFVLHTPLMWLDKAQTWDLAFVIGGNQFIETIIKHTHTCYEGNRTILHPWGYGCGKCPACELRAKGFRKFKQNR